MSLREKHQAEIDSILARYPDRRSAVLNLLYIAQEGRGIRLLNKHGVEWNAMAVVNDFNADYPLDFYRFFRDNGCTTSDTPNAKHNYLWSYGLTLRNSITHTHGLDCHE